MYLTLDTYTLNEQLSNFDEFTIKLVDHICKSIINARSHLSKIDPDTEEGKEILEYKGYTGINTRHFYNNICSMDNCRYLEVIVGR